MALKKEGLQVEYGGVTIRITISIGLAEYTKGQSFNQIIRTADDLLYQAKRSGRNRVC